MTPQRLSEPCDWAAVLTLIRRAFAGMEGRIDPPSSLNHLTAQDLAHGPGEVWAIGDPVQACVVLTPLPHALHVGKLAVAPDAQGRGHARALIATATERARALGLPALELQVRVELVENHAVFAALGFRQVGESRHPGYDRATSVIFSKPV
ncbi:MAG: GNAT family N-acetyltransferase [Paracoccaceae bacterium]|nr:GNAT family N-acetyltransferase [Paracoccaceae bacterium]